jgi:hypothetical protein
MIRIQLIELIRINFDKSVFVNSSFEELARMLVVLGGPKAVLLKQQQEQQEQISARKQKQG